MTYSASWLSLAAACTLLFSGFSVKADAIAGHGSAAQDASSCSDATVLVVDAFSAHPRRTQAHLRTIATRHGASTLLSEQPVRSLEGGSRADHFISAFRFNCRADASAAISSPEWNRVLPTLTPSIYQRVTLFSANPQHTEPSRQTAQCHSPVYFVLKGLVSDTPRYMDYIKTLSASGLLDRHEVRREVVMSPSNPTPQSIGTGFAKGEFFEILRFPCLQEAEAFWSSPEYLAIVPLRVGAMRADVWVYNAAKPARR